MTSIARGARRPTCLSKLVIRRREKLLLISNYPLDSGRVEPSRIYQFRPRACHRELGVDLRRSRWRSTSRRRPNAIRPRNRINFRLSVHLSCRLQDFPYDARRRGRRPADRPTGASSPAGGEGTLSTHADSAVTYISSLSATRRRI